METMPLDEWVDVSDPKLRARLLYASPVCFLVTSSPSASAAGADEKLVDNVMTVSWLACTDNAGGLMMAVNKRRHTAGVFARAAADASFVARFTLTVPTGVPHLERALLRVGGTSGGKGDKFEYLSRVEHVELQRDVFVPGFPPAIVNDGCVAHMACTVLTVHESPDRDHHVVLARITAARVHPSFWDGKRFMPLSPTAAAADAEAPQLAKPKTKRKHHQRDGPVATTEDAAPERAPTGPDVPPGPLKFVGSQTFA